MSRQKGKPEITMSIEMESMAIAMPQVAGHPNRVGFRGVLTLVDEPSDQPPGGAREHRVILTKAAAEEALPSLLGMGVDYTVSLDGHDRQCKVGVITRAEVVGAQLEIGGFLYGKDFPDLVDEMKKPGLNLLKASALGMSYELTAARILDMKAQVWTVTKATFTGAAILRREKAAYRKTWVELSGEENGTTSTTEESMNEAAMENFVNTAARLAGAAESLERVLGKIEAQHAEIGSTLDRIVAAVDEGRLARADVQAAAGNAGLESRMAEMEKANTDLKAQATRLARKTFSPMVSALLGKYEAEGDMNAGVLDKTLSALSVEQRIAVKAEMARAGILK